MLPLQAGDVVRFRDPVTARYRFVRVETGTVLRVDPPVRPDVARVVCVVFGEQTLYIAENTLELVGRKDLEHTPSASRSARRRQRR